MCGRFVQAHDPAEYAEHFGAALAVPEALAPSWNVAPTDSVYAVAEHEDDRLLGTFRWGLIPWFAKDRKIGARNINARSETIAEKPAFRAACRDRRCLVPASGFYEWTKDEDGNRLPWYIHHADDDLLTFAGIWQTWDKGDEPLTTCAIVTTGANKAMSEIHNRMPVVLSQSSSQIQAPMHNQQSSVLRQPYMMLYRNPEELLQRKSQRGAKDPDSLLQ